MRQSILLLMSFILVVGCGQEQVSERAAKESIAAAKGSECELLVGYDIWEPYAYVDVGRAVKGLDIELISRLSEKAQCALKFEQGTWVELLLKLQQGEVDVLLGASKTQAREEFALFSHPYRSEEFSLYMKKGAKVEPFTLEQMIAAGNRIGVVNDYYYGREVAEFRDDGATSGQFIEALMSEMNVARLLDDDIDAFLEDSLVGASMIRRKGLSEEIKPQQTRLKTGEVYIMFSKSSVKPELVEQFNLALGDLKQHGEYQKVFDLYLN